MCRMSLFPLFVAALFCVICIGFSSGCGCGCNRKKTTQYPNTVKYWQDWANLRTQHNEAVDPLDLMVPQQCREYVEWQNWLAEQTLLLPQIGVDPELISLATEFSEMYQQQAENSSDLADLLEVNAAHVERSNSGWTLLESAIRGAFGDPFGVSNELTEADNQIEEAAQVIGRNSKKNEVQAKILFAKREQLKARLISEYGEESIP